MTEFSVMAQLGILLARPGALIDGAPAFGGAFAPVPVRLGIAVVVAIMMAPVVPPLAVQSLAGLGLVVGREMAIGLLMALALRAVLSGAELGGHLTGSQLTLSYGSVVDPQGGVRNNLIAGLYSNLALLTFLGMNGHHMLLRTLARSYDQLPIGIGGVGPSMGATVVQMLGVIFELGVRLAAPIVVVMLLVEVGTALMARVAPTLNLMAVAPPVRLAVGLLALGAMIPFVPPIIRGATAGLGDLLMRALGAFR